MYKSFNKCLKPLLFIFLFLTLLQLPNTLVKNEHDLGSQAAYEYWLSNGLRYGIDFFQNVGPYGFLNYPHIYSGFFFFTKVLLNAFLVFSLLYLSPKLNLKVFLIFLFSLWLYEKADVFIYILLHVAFLHILKPSTKPKLILSIFIAALLCLAKSTCLFITLSGVIVLVLKSYLQNERCAERLLIFLFFLVTLWLAAGQPIQGFFYYVKGAINFSSGYNEAMAIQEPIYVTFSAMVVGLYYLCQLSRGLVGIDAQVKKNFLLDSLFFVFLFFTVWKHGFVRADAGHNSIYFAYAIFAIGMQHIVIYSNRVDIPRHSSALPVVILASSFFLFLPSRVTLDEYIFHHLSNVQLNIKFLFNIHKEHNSLQQQLNYFKDEIHLPEFEKITNGAKVGYLGMKPAVMLYNKFNYITNPSTISFAAWNPTLLLSDSAFFARNVDYLIVEIETTDKRYLPLDSSLSKLEILSKFRLVESRNNLVLLQKKTYYNGLSFQPYDQPIIFNLGDWQTLQNDIYPTWMKIDLIGNPIESMLAIPYKPMHYELEFKFNSEKISSYRFIPVLGRTGFLLSPEILNNVDLVNYFTNTSVQYERPTAFRIICRGPKFLCKRKGSIQYSQITGL